MAQLTAGEIIWKINGDASGFNNSIRKADKGAKKLGSSWKSTGLKIAGVLGTIGLGALVKRLIKAGSDAEEVAQKFGVVFKSVGDEAANYGLSRTESKKLLSDTGDLLSGFGLTGKEALNLSGRVQRLAVDLASFSNVQGGTKFASEALTKGLFGETEQMKTLGIVINQNSAEFKGLVAAYQQTEGKTLLQAKALTILQMATEQSKNAIGDFQRSMSSYANQSRIAEANVANLEETLGTKLLPIAGLAVKVFNSVVVELDKTAQSMGKFISSAKGAETISRIIGKIAGNIAAIGVLAEPIFEAIIDAFKDIGSAALDLATDLGLVGGEFSGLSTIFTLAGKAIRFVGSAITLTMAQVSTWIKQLKMAAIVASEFFDVVKGKKSIEDFGYTVRAYGILTKELNQKLFEQKKKTADAFLDIFKTGDEADKLNKKATAAYKKTSKSFADSVRNSLLVKNKNAEADKKNRKNGQENITALNKEKDAYLGLTGALRELAQWFDKTAAKNQALTKVLGQVSGIASEVGSSLEGMMTGILDIQTAQAEKRLSDLDEQMEKELEAAGVSDAITQESLEKEIAAAKKAGDTEKAIEKEKALERLKIEKKFAKEKAKIEYELALLRWQMQLATAIATAPLTILNGITAGFQIGPWGGAIFGALAAVAAGIQIAAIAASKPSPPKFQAGGIVPGNQIAGDSMAAQVNSGEMILNGAQQNRLFNIADGRTETNNNLQRVAITEEATWAEIYQASKNGDLFIDRRAVTDK
jgi:hypothetical protein